MLFLFLNGGENLATIEQSIAISDGVTGPLARMEQGAVAAANRFDQAANAANRVENSVQKIHSENIGAVGAATSVMTSHLSAANVGATQVATSVGGIYSAAMMARSGIVALGVTIMTVFGAISAVVGVVLGAFHSISSGIHSSDEYSGILARMKLITKSQQEAVDLNDQIYYSALRARGSYAGMADSVSKIGLTAKEAFPDPKQIVPFVEGIQKLFTVGGTGIQQQADAMLQLTQALGSGKLQGDEFRSIAEAAPMIEQMVAKYMGVSQGALKELSSKGAITAEIIKNAILGNLDEINEKFLSMPMTWGQIWQNLGTQSYRAFVPVWEQINALANSPAIQAFVNGIAVGMIYVGAFIAGVINNVRGLGGIAMEVGSYIGEWLGAGFVVLGQVAELVLPYVIGMLMSYGISWAATNIPIAVHIGLMAIVNTWTLIVSGAQKAWSIITMGLAAAQSILNAVLMMNPIPIVIFLVSAVIGAFAGWMIATNGLRETIAGAFSVIAETTGNVINFMIRRVNDLIGVLNSAATAINNVFGTSIGQVGFVAEVDAKGWGERAGNFVRNFDIHDYMPSFAGADIPTGGAISAVPTIDEIADADKDTSKNTKGIKEAMEITDEDLKYLRDIAEQETINKYTTAEVKIEMGGVHNNVSNDMDLDGVVRYINDNIFDAMVAGAEAVHP